jgi:peptidyl-dipeptidase A
MKKIFVLILVAFLAACAGESEKHQKEVQVYLDEYNLRYKELYTNSSTMQWKVQTHIVEGDTMNAYNSRMADEAMAKFTGSKENIDKTNAYMKWEKELSPIQVKQLKKILFMAAGNPESVSDIVKERIKAETAQTEKLYGYKFMMEGKEVTPNEINKILNESKNLDERRKAWEASKAIGKDLKDGLVHLRELRNKVVQALGYKDYFSYMVSEYGMTNEEMMQLLDKFNKELYPLYRELHTYARYELAAKYGVKDVPDYIPAHWLTNKWGQDWNEMISVKGMNLDSSLQTKPADWFPHQSERFYVSIGFDSLPQTFWEKSSLYPVPKDAGYKKNTHASAWHIDLDKDVRSLMSIEPNAEWYETVHHEFGHIYYYMTYSIPEVPYLMREGANRAYHEALGSLMGLAAMQKPFAAGIGLVDGNTPTDTIHQLLKDAMNYVVFIPWSAGTMSHFEHDLYTDNLAPGEFNKRWWDIIKKYQGIVPPAERGEEYCDAASKTHINDDPAGYYDYALSFVLLFQVHDYISKNILHQDPHFTNYYGNKEIGKFIGDIMRPGGSGDWRKLLKDKTGEDLSARAMLDYFAPLMDWLKKENAGRKYTLPEMQ